MAASKTILFVCTGNTCRSYMAEVIAKNYLAQLGRDIAELKIMSAGTGAVANDPPTPEARKVMDEQGLDVDDHRSQVLTPELVKKADLILVMTQRQKNHVLNLVPDAVDKVYLLKEYGRDPVEWEKLNQEAQRLYEQIESKKRTFFNQHRKEIEQLEKRKQKLLADLEQIDRELAGWEDKLARETMEEETRLRHLESLLRDPDILDPFGQPLEYYRFCAAQLREFVTKSVDKFLTLKM